MEAVIVRVSRHEGGEGEEMKQYKDRCFRDFDWILAQIMKENAMQVDKWGVQTHSIYEWLAFTLEELGELAEAICEHEYRKGSKGKVIKEAIQVATLALKIAEMYKEEKGAPR